MHDLTPLSPSPMPLHLLLRPAIFTVLVLLVPFIAMRFTTEVNWDTFDFIVAGVLLLTTGVAYEWIARKGGTRAYRAAAFLAVITALLLLWVNLAVGLIGNENNPLNLLYFAVIAVEIVGVLLARFRPQSMARALYATAIAQMLVPVFALAIGRPPMATAADLLGIAGVFAISAFFAVLFAGSGLLFGRGGEKGAEAGGGRKGEMI